MNALSYVSSTGVAVLTALLNPRDLTVPDDRRWRVVVSLRVLEKAAVLVGSKLLVPAEVKNRILVNSEASQETHVK